MIQDFIIWNLSRKLALDFEHDSSKTFKNLTLIRVSDMVLELKTEN